MEISAKKVYLGIPIFSARFGFFWKKGIDFFGKKAEKRVYLGIPFFSARYGKKVSEGRSYKNACRPSNT